MTPQEALSRVIEHREIFREEMLELMRAIMSGEVSPTLIWGSGLNVRVSGLTLFGEVKLPVWSAQSNSFGMGPQAPLTFGIRF